MSGGGDNDTHRLVDEQLRLQKEELEEKRKAIEQQRFAIIQGQGTQRFDNPDNPHPPTQIIQSVVRMFLNDLGVFLAQSFLFLFLIIYWFFHYADLSHPLL